MSHKVSKDSMYTLGQELAGHARASNRRRACEELLWALCWWLAGAAALLALHSLFLVTYVAVGLGAGWALAVLIGAAFRYRRRRDSACSVAARIDRECATTDLLQTALAIESADGPDETALQRDVRARAAAAMPSLAAAAVAPVRVSPRPVVAAVAAVALCACAVLLAPEETRARELRLDVQAGLPRDARLQLAKEIAALQELQESAGVGDAARDRLDDAIAGLRRAQDSQTPQQALGGLSRAERALSEVASAEQSAEMLDPDKLRSLTDKQLAQALIDATERNDHKLADAASGELARRMGDNSAYSHSGLSRSLEAAVVDAASRAAHDEATRSDTVDEGRPSGGPMTYGERTRFRKQALDAAQHLRRGDREQARRALAQMGRERQRLTRELGRESSNPRMDQLSQARANVHRARAEQLARMNGSARPPGDGRLASGDQSGRPGAKGKRGAAGQRGQSGGQPGSGPSGPGAGAGQSGEAGRAGSDPGARGFSLRGTNDGTPGGGGGGSGGGRQRANAAARAGREMTDAEQVHLPEDIPPEGVVRLVRRVSDGERHIAAYRRVHQLYSAVAEQAVRREAIPLTRRDYIRDYFHALLPESQP